MRLKERLPEHSSAGKISARCIVGNLVWTHGGTVWGIWRVAPVSYRYLSHSGKLSHHESVRQALIGLPPESVILSVCPPLNLADSAASILKGAEGSPAWYTETAESINDLTAWDPFERWFYVGARLGSGGGWRGEMREQSAGLLRRAFVRPTEHDIRSRIAQARKVQKELGASLKLTRPGASEIRWLYARALRRGIRDLGLTPGSATEIHAPGLASIGEVVATEGGDRRDHGRGVLTRYLRVAEPGTDAVGYQCHIALADMPGLYEFPGEEILFGLESFDFPVDWAIKMHRISNAESRRLLAKKSRALMEQLGGKGQLKEIERTGAIPPDLAEAHEALQAHRDRLMALKSEGNVRTTIAMCVWAEDLPTAESRAEAVIKAMAPEEWGVQRATGGQAGLLEMGMVGGREAPVVWNYAQHILPTDIAALAPFAGSDIGDRDGMLLGARMDCATPRPVLWNPEAPLDHEGSASVFLVAALGQGKSMTLKIGVNAIIARGARAAVVDRTSTGEWIRAGKGIQATTGCGLSVISTADRNRSSFDPFRIFDDPKDQKTYAIGFCQLVTQSSSGDLEGISISEAVEAVAIRPEPCLQAVLNELSTMTARGTKGAEEASRKLAAFARSEFGPMAFDPMLLPADLSADLVVFHVPDLALPDRATMENEHMARKMLTEQIGALGVFYLIAAAGRVITLAEKTRFSVFVGDEAWAWTSSPQGNQLLVNTATDGRKRRGAVWLASQHPSHVADPALLALLPTRFVFGQGDGAGITALRLLGVEPTDELRDKVEKDLIRRDDPDSPPLPARCLMRDTQGRVGEIVIRPPSRKLAAAFETNPKRIAAYDALPALEPNGNGEIHPERLGEFPVVST